MDEKETLTQIEITDETIKNLEEGTVEIKAEPSGQKSSDKSAGTKSSKKNIAKFLLGMVAGMLLSLIILVVVAFILLFGIRIAPKNSFLSNAAIYKINLLRTILNVVYYEDVTDDEVLDGIYRGIMRSTGDKYTVYYSADDMKLTNASWEGKFYGIGAVLTTDPASSYTLIDSVELGSPAEKAGVKAGDYIIEVDGTDVAGMSVTEVVKLVRGEKDTDVNLVLARKGEKVEVTITRGEITIDAVYYEKMEDGIGYIQIASFSDAATEQFIDALNQSKKDNVKGIIIDLRGNPGGGLDVAVDMCRQFMPAGLIVYTEDKQGKRINYTCDGSKQWDIPMVVLTDENSASASEIMTAALKDSGVATIVGKKTYGKGVYQSVYPIPDGSVVKVTAGKFYSPNGECFHQIGIEPDVEVDLDVDAYLEDETDTQLDKAIEVLKSKMKP